jgi:hypothetical protein
MAADADTAYTGQELSEIVAELRRLHASKEEVTLTYLWRSAPRLRGIVPAGGWKDAKMRLDTRTATTNTQVTLIFDEDDGDDVSTTLFPVAGYEYQAMTFNTAPPKGRRPRTSSETGRRNHRQQQPRLPTPPARAPRAQGQDDDEHEHEHNATPRPRAHQPPPRAQPDIGQDETEEDDPTKEHTARKIALEPSLWGLIFQSPEGQILLSDVFAAIDAEVSRCRGGGWDQGVLADIVGALRAGIRTAARFPEMSADTNFCDAQRQLLKRLVMFNRRAAGVSGDALAALSSAVDASDDPKWLVTADARAAAQLKTRQWTQRVQVQVPVQIPAPRSFRGRGRSFRGGRGRGKDGADGEKEKDK